MLVQLGAIKTELHNKQDRVHIHDKSQLSNRRTFSSVNQVRISFTTIGNDGRDLSKINNDHGGYVLPAVSHRLLVHDYYLGKGLFRVSKETHTVLCGGSLTRHYSVTPYVKSGRQWTVMSVTIRYVRRWLTITCKRSHFTKHSLDITFAPFRKSEHLCKRYTSVFFSRSPGKWDENVSTCM